MNPGIIIQARLGSSRFPAKIAELITPDRNLLEFMAEPICNLRWPAVLAMPDTEEHRLFAGTLQLTNLQYFFGAENDVLSRFIQAAHHFDFTTVVRVCGDNPCLNISYLNRLMDQWKEDLDYLAYFDSKGTPATKTHYGLFSEIASVAALERIDQATGEAYFHEHVTPYFYEHPDRFKIGKIDMPEPFWSGEPLRFTVDTRADFEMMKYIASKVDVQNIDSLLDIAKTDDIRRVMKGEIEQNSK